MNFDALDMGRLRGLGSNKWNAYGKDVIPAWVADMDFEIAEPIREELTRAIAASDIGYPGNDYADPPLAEVFAARVGERYGWNVNPARVEFIIDVVQGLYLGLYLYSRAHESAVVFTPIYPNFLAAARDVGRPAIQNALVPDGNTYVLDLDALRAQVDKNTRVLMLCNPHNATGRVLRRDELEALAEIAMANDLVVLADEIFADLVYDGRQHVPFVTLGPEVEARTITFYSATKAFNLAGLRTAAVAFGSKALHEQFHTLPRRILGGHNSLALAATRVAWEKSHEWLEELLPYLEGNRDFIGEFLAARIPDIRYLPPEGTFLAWLDCRELELPGGPFEYFLERAKVAMSDGALFGDVGEGHVRLNFATPRKLLEEILERLAGSLA